jgi:hypothetical protein
MTISPFKARILEESRLTSRALALAAASDIADNRDQPDQVLAAYDQIEVFLLGGDLADECDLRARRAAVSQHRDNIRHAMRNAENLATFRDRAKNAGDVAVFLDVVCQYYARLAPPPREETPVDPAWARLRELLAAAGSGGSTVRMLAALLREEGHACTAQDILHWLGRDLLKGLVETDQAGHRWTWTGRESR